MNDALRVCWIGLAMSLAQAEPRMQLREWGAPLPLQKAILVAAPGQARTLLRDALAHKQVAVEEVPPEAALAENGLQWRPELLAGTVVLLGGIHTNRAMLPLYAHSLSLGDAAYPGGPGFVVRTIARPFGPGTAAIALEASTPAGEAAAVARFGELLDRLEGGKFPPTLEAHLSEERQRDAGTVPDLGMRYLLTGRPEYAREGFRRLRQAMEAETGFFRYGDYGIERYVWEYHYLQDAPGVAPEEVREIDQGLLLTAVQSAGQWWRCKDGRSIGGRHQTMGTSAFTAAVHLLLRRGNPNEEARQLLELWWAESQAYWRNACSTFHDDLEGIPTYYSPEPTLEWALRLGLDGYLRDQLPLVIRRAYAVVDNLGCYAGTGTYEECRPGDLFKPVPWGWLLAAANFFHPGQGYDWLRQNLPNTGIGTWGVARNFGGARTFARPGASGPPEGWLGILPVPLGPYRYRQLAQDRQEARAQGQRYLAAPLERCFEKLCFRDSFSRQGQYLVLEGYQTPAADNQPPRDANSLIRYTDLGHIWLHANTEKSGNLFRSAVFCTDGLNDSPQPAGCELQAWHNGSRIGLAASCFPDYGASDWTRNVIWRRGRYFVVIDLLQQNREGKFGLICTFRTPQRAWLEPDGLRAREGEAEMRLRNADAVRLSLQVEQRLEGAAIPTLLREVQPLDGKVGTIRVFRNLLYASDPEHPADLEIRPWGPTAAMVRGSIRGEEELALVAAAPRGAGLRIGPFETDAQVLYVGLMNWAQAGGTGLRIGGRRLEGAEGVAPAEVRTALERLWARARPPVRPRPSPARAGAAKRRWRFAGFSPWPAAAPAPVLTSEPEGQGFLPSLLDGVVSSGPTVRWPAGTEVRLTLDLRESRPIVQIDFQTGQFGPYNTLPDPTTYPPPRRVRGEFSDDAFQADVRRKELLLTSDCTFEGLHKGTVFPILRWTCRQVGEKARYVRLIFGSEDWPEGLGLNELSVRPAGPNAAILSGYVLRDVDGDGRDEIVAWSDQGELVGLRSDGSLMLRKQFPGFITAVECYPDLSPEGPRLLVTTREARLYCLRPDGSEVWRVDFLESARQNADLPTGYSLGLLKRPDGSPVIVVGNYNLASFVSPEGKVLHYERLPAAYQTMTLSRGFDYDDDGKEDLVSTEVWGCLSVLDADLRRRAGGSLPRGRGILLEYWQPPTPQQARALVCTENGVGLLNLKTLQYEWLHAITPINDGGVADLDGDGRPEVVLAKEDGYLLVYDETGRLRRRVWVGEPVRAVAVVPRPGRPPLVAAALPGRIVGFGPSWAEPTVLAVGDYGKLAPSGQAGVLFAFGERAWLEALELGPRS